MIARVLAALLTVAMVLLGAVRSAAADEPTAWGSFVDLPVPGFEDAVVWIPLPRSTRDDARPVVVALHGLRGRADWTCHVGRALFESSAFVLCPAGTALPPKSATDRVRPRYTFPSVPKTGAEIAAGLRALAASFGGVVDATDPVLYGHSLGAIFGAELVLSAPSSWSRVLLSEGGYSAWLGPGAGAFARAHARSPTARVVFACGTSSCFTGATQAATALRRAGASADVEYARGAGHRSYGPIVDAMATKIGWLVAGDPRFS